MDPTRLGILLLENPFIRREDVERCLKIQRLGGWHKPIGQVLLEEGVISEEKLNLVLTIQERRRASARAHARRGAHERTVPRPADLLQRARSRRATDLLLALGRRPRARIGGRLEPLSPLRLEPGWMREFLDAALEPEQRDRLSTERHFVTKLRGADGRACRVTLFHDSFGPAASIRLVPERVPSLSALGHAPAADHLIDSRRGLVLVTGGPRSGKSTTIASMIESLAKKRAGHIVVLDEHHEFEFAHGAGLVTRKHVPRDPRALAGALAAAFREDPDVIVVGELVGCQSVELSMQLASTGHLVIAGMQASSTIAALRRLEEGISDQALPNFRANLASELRGVIFQDLVPACKDDGLVLAAEMIVASKAFWWALAQGRLDRIPILLSLDSEQDCSAMDDRLMDLVESNDISIEEAFARARDQHRFLMTAS